MQDETKVLVQKLYKRIRDCKGIDNCPGKSSPYPIVLPNDEQVEIMVITEQPNKTVRKIPESEICERLATSTSKKYASVELREYLGDEFANSIYFRHGKYYWTHLIKCPGQIREKRENEKVDKEVCANTYLFEEIFKLRPKLILSFGAHPSEWILCHSSLDKKDWQDYVWEEIRHVVKGDFKAQKMEERLYEIAKETCIEAEDGKEKHETKVCFFFHPSGRNATGRYINRKIFKALKG